MRTKRDPKIPQNLVDFVHSINNTKTKNKASVSVKKTVKVGNQKLNVRDSGESKRKNDRDRNVVKNCDRDECVEDEVMNGSDGFVGDLSGAQFPPINAQMRNSERGKIQDCLVQEITDNGNGNVECDKPDAVSEGSASKTVNKDDSSKKDGEKGNDNAGNIRGVWNMKFAEIVNANRIDNKLMVISTKMSDDGGQVTYSEARVGMVLDKAKPRKLPIWVKILNVPMEAWSVKGVSALASSLGKPIIIDDMTTRMCAKGECRLSFATVLIEIEAGKDMKKEIEGIANENVRVNSKSNADRPFTVVQNRKVNYEKEKKQDNTMGNPSGAYEKRDNSRKGNNETREENEDKTKRKSTMNKSNGKGGVENEKNEEVMKDASTYNRYTLLNALVGEDELIPPIDQRKIVDEYMNQENEVCDMESPGWNNEMKKYYKDRKELFDATKELELEEDVENGMQDDGEFGLRNEANGEDGNIHVGMSTSDKQKEVRKIIKEENLQLCGIIETHIKYQNILQVSKKVFENWDFTSYREDNSKGCRIIVGWNSNKLRVWVIAKAKQCMFLLVETLCQKIGFFCTIVYASNSYNERRKLWKELGNQKIITNGVPWVIMGDFNVTLSVEEHFNGSSAPSSEMNEFSECIRGIEVEDILSSGLYNNVERKFKVSQAEVDRQPHNDEVKAKICKILSEYYEAIKDESNIIMQKAKVEWLKDGDRNTKFFHKIIKGRLHKGRVMSVCNEKGERFENEKVVKQFVKHFQEFLRKKDVVTNFPIDKIVFPNKLSIEEADRMCRDVNEVEVKNAMFDIEDSKAPGPDGYTTRFYKSAWSVIGKDICKAVKDFLVTGRLLGESAFIAGRQITDNILLAQELFKGYNRKQKTKKVAFKIDLQKAYDTINQDFIKVVLVQFGFPSKMVDWIMVCVSTTKFSININGERDGYFSRGRGLRQGDPMSPYLFTLVIEVFNIIMRKNIGENKDFKYHHRCRKLEITHLCFADGLLVFCHKDTKSVSVIKEAFEEFSSYSCLKANMNKSTVFFGGMTNAEQSIILDIVPFAIGKLPVRYLGVPLITKKVNATDCKPLIDKVKNRVLDWRNKALSYSGRLQLISSVLRELTKGKAKVSWDNVCKPKEQGWLGIKNLQVKWVNTEILRGKSVWVVNASANSSARWNEMLKLKDKIRKHVLWKIGDGQKINTWYDNWNAIGPLCEIITTREIYEAGLSIKTNIVDLVMSYEDNWPDR
ncbi:RNA-directed DNA polymerase, eukaryota, reverse transcriptase zinc-binding domain protein [Tanacetum coccineum]|uniref:RNA-directed DNA polymerase, eukaryota, reverse transcriptase zinc-binding domain protein n=1 Tax=Tanacetum coccineum TaxID=301880 RepID=A0ABQ4ZWR2_9ASTR